jgi:CheY-like chemotaxis protein
MKKLTIDKTNFANINSTLEKISKDDCDVIYIKDSLGENYMEFKGLELAHHIRLSPNLQEKRYLPIVITSHLDGMLINKLSSLGRILFTKNIFLNNLPNSYSLLDEKNFKKEFLDKIVVDKPTDNSSNHDISNQWSIYQWAKFLDIQSQAIDKNENQIKDSLYFKYILAQNNKNQDNSINYHDIKKYEDLNVLCIDDQIKKGWGDIFRAIFGENVKLVDDLKHLEKGLIKEIDLVILDMRLVDSDNSNDLNSLTGHKVLEVIKKINKGIQVIVFTASQKSEVLKEADKNDILGYIQKESSININDNFNEFQKLITKAYKRKYLKEVFDIQQEILNLGIFNNENEKYKRAKFEISNIFDVLNSNLSNRIQMTVISLYKILEILITENNIKAENSYDKTIQLLKILNLKEKYIKEVSIIGCTRNYLIHPKEPHPKSICKQNLIKSPNKDNILIWFKMTKDILSKLEE